MYVYACVCMYICMYVVCICVCLYVHLCICVCIQVWMDLWCRCKTAWNKLFNLEAAVSFITSGKRSFYVLESQNRDNLGASHECEVRMMLLEIDAQHKLQWLCWMWKQCLFLWVALLRNIIGKSHGPFSYLIIHYWKSGQFNLSLRAWEIQIE